MTPPAPIKPLVVRFGAFGDMILLIPALKILARRYGAPCEVVGSGPWTEPLYQRVSAAGRRFLLTSRRAPYWFNRSQRRLVAWLRQRPPGPVYVFESDEKSHWLLHRGGVRPGWICSYRDWPREPGEHIMAHGIRLAIQTPPALQAPGHSDWPGAAQPDPSSAATAKEDTRPMLTDEDRRDCLAWLASRGLADRPLVLFQPGNKKTMRRGFRRRRTNVDYWPEANWARVAAGVREILPSARVVLCGSSAERPLAEDIVARLAGDDHGVVMAAGDLPVPRLLALLERAHSMISVNTGPAHAAAAMGCPLVVMFGRHAIRSVSLYAPPATTAPVKIVLTDAETPEACVTSISPETVIAAWRGLPPV